MPWDENKKERERGVVILATRWNSLQLITQFKHVESNISAFLLDEEASFLSKVSDRLLLAPASSLSLVSKPFLVPNDRSGDTVGLVQFLYYNDGSNRNNNLVDRRRKVVGYSSPSI